MPDTEDKRIDTRHLFRAWTTRKPADWDATGVVSYATLSDAQKEALATLPVIEAPGLPRDYLDPAPPPMECLVVHAGGRYYANTEGYGYPRYLVRIINWPAA